MTGRSGSRPPATSILGLDIGGSTTRAVLEVDGAAVAAATGASASLAATGRAAADRVIADVLTQLRLTRTRERRPLQAVCVGTAGSGAADAVEWITVRLRHLVEPESGDRRRILVVNDSRLVLAAEDYDSGIALVAGTGSTAIGVLGEREERAGGWGYLLGDEGGGYWIVREAMRELCRRHDEHEPAGPLGAVLLGARFSGAPVLGARFSGADILDLIADFHRSPAPSGWAALAPAVLDSHDPFAATICAKSARCLAQLVGEVAGRLAHPVPVPVVVSGGLAGHAVLAGKVADAIAELAPATPVTIASHAPVEGAVHLARRLAATASAGA